MENNNQKAHLDMDDEFDYISKSRFKAVQPSLFSGMDIDTQPQELSANEPRMIPNITSDRPPLIMGADIIAIRDLTGKKRTNAITLLNRQAEELLSEAPKEWFYIPGNVPSSKNSKDIITVKRLTKTGWKEFSVPIPSKPVKEYMKQTKGHWLQGKIAFREEVKRHSWPIMLEFIFIRDSLRRFDFINAAQILMDLMSTGEIKDNKYSWLPDDESCYVVPVFRPCVYYHPKLAGVLIRIIN